jgi:hypothetical protein
MSDGSDDTSVYSESNSASNALGETTFENAKRALVDLLMQEFWARFDNDWIERYIGSETTSIPPSRQTASTSAQGTAQKRQRREEDDDHKRSIPQQTLPGGEGLALSCPFREVQGPPAAELSATASRERDECVQKARSSGNIKDAKWWEEKAQEAASGLDLPELTTAELCAKTGKDGTLEEHCPVNACNCRQLLLSSTQQGRQLAQEWAFSGR